MNFWSDRNELCTFSTFPHLVCHLHIKLGELWVYLENISLKMHLFLFAFSHSQVATLNALLVQP